MAKNFVQPGKTITLNAPYDRTPGQGALVGAIFGVSLATVASGSDSDFGVEGVWDLAKTSAQAWSQGARIYWDDTNKRCDTDPTVGPLIGVATEAAANPSSTGRVRLNEGVPGLDEAVQGAQIVSLTDNGGGAAADDTIAAIAAAACAGGATPTAAQVDTAVAALTTTTKDAVKELSTKINTVIAALRTVGIIKT